MSAVVRLQRGTAAAHRRVESSPFARAMLDGRVEHRHYVDYLRAIAVVLDTLRTQTQRHGTGRERLACERLPAWSDLLTADIADLEALAPLANPGSLDAARDFAANVCRRIADGSAYLLGVVYVLFGSHNGNRMLAPTVEATLALGEGAGVRYLSATQAEGDGPWLEFKAFLDQGVEHARGARGGPRGRSRNLRRL